MSFDTPCEVAGVKEAPANTLVTFTVVRMKEAETLKDREQDHYI